MLSSFILKILLHILKKNKNDLEVTGFDLQVFFPRPPSCHSLLVGNGSVYLIRIAYEYQLFIPYFILTTMAMTPEEMNQEVLECARYGEEDDLRALLNAGANVNFTDAGGSTAMHKAAANGEEACLKVLHSFGATYSKNGTGNTPAHWAAQNAKAGALKFIIENYEVDMLDKNDLGRSVLTEAFQSKCTDCIELCLSHESASEERLINPDGKKSSGTSESAPSAEMTANSNMETEGTENSISGYDEANAVTHSMQFGADVRIRVRELPITRADNPFGTDTAPEDDTTGLSVWPASIILGQWVAQLARDGALPDMRDKMVLELGAGCGLPAIVAGTQPILCVKYTRNIHIYCSYYIKRFHNMIHMLRKIPVKFEFIFLALFHACDILH